ncbi:MAG: hypothetical protein KKG99_06100 [Bacteroidetes bacterium]|nr:hypothetical protein [Bacteroidota bacterium]
MKDKIVELIYKTIDEINEHRGSEEQISKTENTKFLGQNGVLDSLGLINLIVSLEQSVNDELNVEITLADERAMMMASSPFRTVSALAEFIEKLIAESKSK